MEKKNTFWTEMARPVVVLVVICLVASALLGLTNAKTAPVIEENIRIEAEKTRKEVLPAASEFTELEVSEELKANGVTGIFGRATTAPAMSSPRKRPATAAPSSLPSVSIPRARSSP